MKFDSRNPFAAWGFEQEVYTKTSGNDQDKTGMVDLNDNNQGYESRINARSDRDKFYANGGTPVEMSDKAKSDWSDNHKTVESIFSNNENMMPTPYLTKAYAYDTDIEYKQSDNAKADNDLYNNTELNYYGIQYVDLYANGDSQGEIVPVVAE